jgi:hypothetical protein
VRNLPRIEDFLCKAVGYGTDLLQVWPSRQNSPVAITGRQRSAALYPEVMRNSEIFSVLIEKIHERS